MTLALTPWHDPPSHPELVADAVHLWRFPLVCRESLENLLDEQELQRARRLRIPEKARAFVVARARLRQILAAYLGHAPEDLRFTYGLSGKPALAGLVDAPSFNLAHAGDWGLCAVTRAGEVGVDLEFLDPGLDYALLAERFFSPTEQRWLQKSPAWRRRRAFFRIWTRKEAWLKGKGGGFSDPQQDLGPVHLERCCTYDGRWWLRSVFPARHYLAALAVSRPCLAIQRWNGWLDFPK